MERFLWVLFLLSLLAVGLNACGNDDELDDDSDTDADTDVDTDTDTDTDADTDVDARIELTWSDNSDNEDSFEIQRKSDSGSYQELATVDANSEVYVDEELSHQTAYTYRVRALKGVDASPWSNEASAATKISAFPEDRQNEYGQFFGMEVGERVLARVELEGMLDELGLPVYAHLVDSGGDEYALVVVPRSVLDLSMTAFAVLDGYKEDSSYFIAQGRSQDHRDKVSGLFTVLLDDGNNCLIRVSDSEKRALFEQGMDLQQLGDKPMILNAPRTIAQVPTAGDRSPGIAAMMDQVTSDAVNDYVSGLSGEISVVVGGSDYTFETRYTDSGTPIEMATQYSYEFLEDQGLDVSYHSWSYGGYSGRNVIAEQPGTESPDEIVIISAHIDDMPSHGSAPGADDNASGCTGVMLAAEIFASHDFSRTIRYAIFTGEEQGKYGSQVYAGEAYDNGDNIVAVYNIDMIAYDSDDDPSLRLRLRTPSSPGYAGDEAIADVFLFVVDNYGLDGVLRPILDLDGVTSSDHYSFWINGYSAIQAAQDGVDDKNPHYHTPQDTLSNINLTYLTNYLKASIGTVAHLASSLGEEIEAPSNLEASLL